MKRRGDKIISRVELGMMSEEPAGGEVSVMEDCREIITCIFILFMLSSCAH
jgi:hypothetical protein